jgi:hypothetical protein
MEDIKKTTVHFEDGRRADKVVQEVSDPTTGESKIVTEVFVEPKIEKKLSHRFVETKKPVVVRREIEEIDEVTGEIISRKIESTEPEARMELREHIQTANSVAALNANDCDCYVTQKDMEKCFVEGFSAIAKALKDADDHHEVHAQNATVEVVDEPKRPQSILGDKLQQAASNLNTSGTLMWGAVAALSAVLVYVVLFM